MALHRDAANESATRTVNLFAVGPVTLAGFINVTNFTIFCSVIQLRLDGSNNMQIEVSTAGNMYFRTRIGGATAFDTGNIPIVAGQWYFAAATLNALGTVSNLYVRPVSAKGKLTPATPGAPPGGTFTPTNLWFANQGVAADFRFAGWRVWSTVLTRAEIDRESRQVPAAKRTHLRGDYWMHGGTLTQNYQDYSPYASNLASGAAAPSVVDGPPVPIRFRPRRRWTIDKGAAGGGGNAFPEHYYRQQMVS